MYNGVKYSIAVLEPVPPKNSQSLSKAELERRKAAELKDKFSAPKMPPNSGFYSQSTSLSAGSQQQLIEASAFAQASQLITINRKATRENSGQIEAKM